MKLLFIISFLISTATWAKVNPTCAENGVSELTLFRVTAFPEDTDFCSQEKLPPQIVNLVTQIGALYKKSAEFMDLSWKNLLNNPLRIELIGNDSGPWISEAIPMFDSIKVGVFEDWNGEAINAWIFTHELAHVLVGGESHRLGVSNYKLDELMIFREGIGDYIARGSLGVDFTPSEDIPACLLKVRQLKGTESYNLTMDFFQDRYAMYEMNTCCESLEAQGLMTPHAQLICDERGGSHQSWGPETFSPELCFGDDYNCSSHQLGIPLGAFIKNVEEKLSIKGFLLRVLRGFSDLYTTKFSCAMVSATVPEQRFEVSQSDFGAVLNGLRSTLSPGQMSTYDELWKAHAMSKGVEYSRLDSFSRAEGLAMQLTKANFEAEAEGFPADHPCSEIYRNLRMFDGMPEGECRITCSKIKAPTDKRRKSL